MTESSLAEARADDNGTESHALSRTDGHAPRDPLSSLAHTGAHADTHARHGRGETKTRVELTQLRGAAVGSSARQRPLTAGSTKPGEDVSGKTVLDAS